MQTARRRRIESLLHAQGACSVDHLAKVLGVSDMTVRRDLDSLASAGRIVRTHGGAAPTEQITFEFQFLRRARLHQRQKELIGAQAARMIRDGQSVLLDSGTTTLAIARNLCARRDLTVITTSLPIASALQNASGVETLLLGGFVRRGTPDLAGALTESNLESIRADLAFVGADGIDAEGNVYNASLTVGRMLTKMAASAGQAYLVADSSKLGRTALARFANAASWSALITDADGPPEFVQALRQAGVNVILATAESERATIGKHD